MTFSFLNVPRGGGGSTSSCPYSETDMKGFFLTSDQCPAGRVFQYRVGSGIGQNTGYRVGFGSGRSVKICERVFPGISFSLGYFQVFRVFRVFSGIFGYFLGISGMLGDTRNFGFTRYIG